MSLTSKTKRLTTTTTQPQRLPTLECVTCDACQNRVHFVTIATADLTPPSPQFKVAYLRCPVCGAHATRLVEISAHKFSTFKSRRHRFVYRK